MSIYSSIASSAISIAPLETYFTLFDVWTTHFCSWLLVCLGVNYSSWSESLATSAVVTPILSLKSRPPRQEMGSHPEPNRKFLDVRDELSVECQRFIVIIRRWYFINGCLLFYRWYQSRRCFFNEWFMGKLEIRLL